MVCCDVSLMALLQDSEVSDADPDKPGPESCMDRVNAPVYCVCRRPDINCFMMCVVFCSCYSTHSGPDQSHDQSHDPSDNTSGTCTALVGLNSSAMTHTHLMPSCSRFPVVLVLTPSSFIPAVGVTAVTSGSMATASTSQRRLPRPSGSGTVRNVEVSRPEGHMRDMSPLRFVVWKTHDLIWMVQCVVFNMYVRG